MSPSLSNLTEIPIELLEQILLHLPGQDIVKMEAVDRQSRSLICNSPALQHRRELFATGLVDNPRCPCDAVERRKLREGYAHKWSSAKGMVKDTRELRPLRSLDWGEAEHIGNGYFAIDDSIHGLSFLHIPPLTSQKSIEGWSIPPFPFEILDYAAYPPENVIAVAEKGEGFTRMHLVNLRDGSPYYPPPSNIITWEFPPGVHSVTREGMAITGSRLMLYTTSWGEELTNEAAVRWVVVWNWKTGEVLLDLSSTVGNGLSVLNTLIVFLDEFRMVLLPGGSYITELTVFDTLIPQYHPGNLRRLGLPQRFHGQTWVGSIHADHNRPLGTPNRDEPLIADPAQAILIVELANSWDLHALLVIRTQALIDQKPSHELNPLVPWGEWGGDAVVMEALMSDDDPDILIHGAQVVLVWPHRISEPNRHGPYRNFDVQTFDFSRRGRSSQQLLDGEEGETESNMPLEGGRWFRFEPGGAGASLDGELRSLSDGSLFYLDGLDNTLHVWELI